MVQGELGRSVSKPPAVAQAADSGPALVLVAWREVAVGMVMGRRGSGILRLLWWRMMGRMGWMLYSILSRVMGAGPGADVGAVGAEAGAAEGVDGGGAAWRVAPRSLGRSDWLRDFRAEAEQAVVRLPIVPGPASR